MSRALPGIWRDAAHWRTVAVALTGAILLGVALLGLNLASRGLVPALSADHAYLWTRDMAGLLLWLGLASGLGATGYLALTALLGAVPARALLVRLRRG
jgi:hypothetical protein